MPPKRKSDGTAGAASKKSRTNIFAGMPAEVEETLNPEPEDYEDLTKDEIIQKLRTMAEYARSLEETIAASKPKELSGAELEAAVDKVSDVINRGIKKQMSWKPSCKTGGAKWVYDILAPEPGIINHMLGFGHEEPTWKTKKITVAEFENAVGRIVASARYNDMRLKNTVNVHWKPAEGMYKMSGTYGV